VPGLVGNVGLKGINIECHFRVNICYNNELGMISISKVDLAYNHDVLEPPEDHVQFFHTLAVEKVAMVRRFAALGVTRTQVLKVIWESSYCLISSILKRSTHMSDTKWGRFPISLIRHTIRSAKWWNLWRWSEFTIKQTTRNGQSGSAAGVEACLLL
jgi:hypothetical protein